MLVRIILIAYCMTCCGKEESTREVRVSDPTSTTELNGRDGATGKDGKDGAAGATGKDGVNGKDGATAEQNQWSDLVTGKQWLMGATSQQPTAVGLCSGNYKTPTLSELADACYRGLFKVYVAKLGALPATTSWASSSGDALTIATCLATTQATGTQSVIVCMQK